MHRPLWYDMEHRVITLEQAEVLLASEDRQLAKDVVVVDDEPVWVSTVFLVLDHSFGTGPPVLYETMAFGSNDIEAQHRYCTREQAMAGHAEVVAALTAQIR